MKITAETGVNPFIEIECSHCFNYVEIEDVPFLHVGEVHTLYCPVCSTRIELEVKFWKQS